ncbi:MAG TPA: YceD family protein [Gammaproteobacteria bacterium]|nr:YceD family protein [Gammaproteobacteria bacterium]
MVATLPAELDIRRLTDARAELQGTLPLAGMKRLADMALDPGREQVSVQLRFLRDELGRRLLYGKLRAPITCQCQRCLGPVRLDIEHDFAIEFVWGMSQLPQVERNHSPYVLETDEPLSLAELVEDELILAMPVVARHAGLDSCEPPRHDADRDEAADESGDGREKPFAGLARLKLRK